MEVFNALFLLLGSIHIALLEKALVRTEARVGGWVVLAIAHLVQSQRERRKPIILFVRRWQRMHAPDTFALLLLMLLLLLSGMMLVARPG